MRRGGPVESSGWYLIQVDPARSSLDDLPANVGAAGGTGEYAFSSEDAARLAALVTREASRTLSANILLYPTAASLEHPDGAGGHLDASTWAWMTEDDNSVQAGDQGLSIGVAHAWEYLRYRGVHQWGETPYSLTYVAILDQGFDLDPVTGAPLHGNLDYAAQPIQIDLVDNDDTAGGAGDNWHGQMVFGVAAAQPSNRYGSAGTGGEFVTPVLVRAPHDFYMLSCAIACAAVSGVDVISMSVGGSSCNGDWFCDDSKDLLAMAINKANGWGEAVVASAGNDGVDLSTREYIPCELDGVICVGGIDGAGGNWFNYGGNVDLWAPGQVLSTVTPDTVNKVGPDALSSFAGTSAATPFVAGVIGLMKAANPSISPNQILAVLQSTANSSTDPRGAHGYVDAFRSVQGVLPNQPPTVAVTEPAAGAAVGWSFGSRFTATVVDPEVAPNKVLLWPCTVTFSSDRDGLLCSADSPGYYSCRSELPSLSLGTHVITAQATDFLGAVGTASVTIEVVNRPPQVQVLKPSASGVYYQHLPIVLDAAISDPDESIGPGQVTWNSDIDGHLTVGWPGKASLSAGTHVITATATDGQGLTGQDSVSITVLSGAGLPFVEITAPTAGFFAPGAAITFKGRASDPEDGKLTGASLTWGSNVDGPLGHGESITVVLSGPPTPCNPEFVAHTITLTATDSDGHAVSVTIIVQVGTLC